MFVVREVQQDSAQRIKQFLASRKEFGYMTDWDPMFNYSWKLPDFPFGYAMFENGEIVGFLGTIFSQRSFHGQQLTECNIMAWVVDDDFRARLGDEGKGVGRFLMDPVLNMRDVVIAATSPNPRSKVSCRRLGFTTWDEQQVVVPLFPGGFTLAQPDHLLFEAEPESVAPHLEGADAQIFGDHRDLRCSHFLVKNRSAGRYSYFIGTVSLTRKRPVPNCRILNLCYVSDPAVFAAHFSSIRKNLWCNHRIAFLRYDSRFIASKLSAIEFRMPQLRLIRSSHNKFLDLDNLYSELVAYNKN
jgi:hypothetical protein